MSRSTRSISKSWLCHIRLGVAIVILGVVLLPIAGTGTGSFGTATLAQAQEIGFGKIFMPNIIGPGSVTTLQFSINNYDPTTPLTNLAFTDTLPSGVLIATPANATTTCDSVLVAPDGGDTISFSADRLGPSSACVVTVDVTSSTAGTHTNISGDLTSDAGNHGYAAADLTVNVMIPGFSKSFSPDSIPPGGTSTLIFTIDNTANRTGVDYMSFIDYLPTGMVIATPSNASTDCTGESLPILTADPGTNLISSTLGYVGAFSSCSVTVDVTAGDYGQYVNISGYLVDMYGEWTSGKATAVLDVPRKFLLKSFTDDPVTPGDTVTLEFTVTNLDRSNAATDISFTDDLDATLSGLAAVGLPLADPCGAGSQLTGTGLLTLSSGELPPGESCTFNVTLQVPTAAPVGIYTNTTSIITTQVGDDVAVYDPATDRLLVAPAPRLTKTFVNNPVAAGSTVTLAFTITNTSPFSSVTSIEFIDEYTTIFPGQTPGSLPSAGFCGDLSSISILSPGIDRLALSMTGGSLGPGDSCTFDVTFSVPVDMPGGTYHNTTSPVTAMLGDLVVAGNPATDDLQVVAAPALRKSFDDPVIPGDTVTLEFTISHDEFAPDDATDIAFSDDLTFLPGLAATGLPLSDVCGPGSLIDGTTNLNFSGGSLTPGESCVFSVTLQVPATTLAGNYTNTTSNVTAQVLGMATTENPATDALNIAGLTLSKSFTDDPVVLGGMVTLEFTLSNLSPISSTTNISFSDDLDAALSGLTAVGLPANDVCGVGSQFAGTNLLTLTGGNLAPDSSCTFTVALQVPATASPGEYVNTTGPVTADVDGSPITVDSASDNLTVFNPLSLAKSFTDDPVVPGGTVTLEFTITNADPTQRATAIAFTDHLDAALSGLAAVGLPANDVCGAGSQISGTSVLMLTGGNLAPDSSCTFAVTLQVPAGVPLGTIATNITGEVTGIIDGLPFAGDAAMDDLQVEYLTFTKAFDDPTVAGGTSTLTFTIQNLDPNASASGISFSDDLDAVLAGLAAVGLPASDVCGSGSLLSGTSFLTLINGSLGPGASCTFSVTLQVPSTAAPGSFTNTTSDLLLAGLPVSSPATDTLTVNPAEVYLPLVLCSYTPPVFAPDLVVDEIIATSNTVQVVIRNQGDASVSATDEFWVQVYIDPDPAPTAVNQLWYDLGDEGMLWGVTADLLPLAPGLTLTLAYSDAHYWPSLSRFSEALAPGTPVYAQVDAWGEATGYGAVRENHEILGGAYNNISGPVYSTANARRDDATILTYRLRPSLENLSSLYKR